jgi:cell division protein FtsW
VPHTTHADRFFLQISLALVFIGFAFVASASAFESMRYSGSPWSMLVKHAFVVAVAVPVLMGVSSFHYRWWRTKLAWYIMAAVIVMLILTAVPHIGVVTGGSRRWISLGFFQLQPSEFAKLASVILIAKTFYERKNRALGLALVLVCSGLVLKQPDLGTTIIIASSIPVIAYAAGLNLFIFIAVIAGALWVGVKHVMHTPYQMERIHFWLDPYSDPLGSGYNLIQSQHAIGAGGLWGQGYGASLQKLGTLPIPHADFIFSVVCEEIGFLGAAVLIALLAAWVLRALDICLSVPDEFAKLLGFGIVGTTSLQAIINICVATGLFPVTGMTLPFISSGGSSLITMCVATGIILNLSRFADLKY